MEEYLSEKEQWDRVVVWLKEQAPWMAGAIAVVALGFGGWRYWQSSIEQRDLTAAARYEQVLDAFSRNDMSGGLKLADDVVRDFGGTAYADFADLAAARIQVENNQLPQATARLQHVLDATKDKQLALMTRLRLARVQLAQKQFDVALTTLNAVQPGAFAARYAEVRGDVLYAKGDREGALTQYRAARSGGAADGTVDSGLLDLKINELAHS